MARQQAALTLALKCERVICIAPGLSQELIELQHLVEAAGASFHVVGSSRALLGLVTAVDDVIVLADGMFTSIGPIAELLEEGQAILVQPIEQGLAAGFERIDLNHASAGAMRLPGRLIERMADLPPDCDAASALLRIALQAGIRQKPIPVPGQGSLFWTIVRSDEEAHALEPQWIRQRTRGEGNLGASQWLALAGVRNFGPALLHAGSGARMLVIAAALVALLAIGSGWFGWVLLGLAFAGLAWVLREFAVMLARIEFDAASGRKGLDSKELFGWPLDAIIIALAAFGTEMHAGQHFADRLFPPFMLVALLRIMPRLAASRWTAWLEDRGILAAAFAVAIGSGFGSGTIHVAASIVALAGILLPFGQSRLTRP
ncbi:MAG: hypothetical protein ACKOPM_05145 [Novosphingobium sp.]